jgi:hypothetical protein
MAHDGRRRNGPAEQRVDPGFNALPVTLPEALKHSDELLSVASGAHDVVVKERPTEDRNPSPHLMDRALEHEQGVRHLTRALPSGNRPLHRQYRTH